MPHVYGDTRSDTIFGAGYAGAEDRLFFMDVLRHAGRGELSGFAGGANKAMDKDVWESSPYTEADLQKQVDQTDDLYGAEGAAAPAGRGRLRGRRQPVHRRGAHSTRRRCRREYAAIGKTLEDWKATDVIATAALVGGIFGKGGGHEVESADRARGRQAAASAAPTATQVWRDFRREDDPEAPTTVQRHVLPLPDATARQLGGGRACPTRARSWTRPTAARRPSAPRSRRACSAAVRRA